MKPRVTFLCLFLAVGTLATVDSQQTTSASNVIVVTMDGLRWQEVFGGLSSDLLSKEGGGVSDGAPSERRFGGATPAERREKLMPFFWTVVAKRGQVFGDPSSGSTARVTNGLRFRTRATTSSCRASRIRASTATTRSPTPTSRCWNG